MRYLFHSVSIVEVLCLALTLTFSLVSPSSSNHKNLIQYLNTRLKSGNIDAAMLYKSLNISSEAELKDYLRRFLHVRHKKHLLTEGPSQIRALLKEELLFRSQASLAVWPIKKEAVVEGDVILGGLMMVHSRSENVTCGPIMPQGGIQALETMLYTLDYINSQGFNIKIGAHILDDCDQDTYGLEMALDFIKGK